MASWRPSRFGAVVDRDCLFAQLLTSAPALDQATRLATIVQDDGQRHVGRPSC